MLVFAKYNKHSHEQQLVTNIREMHLQSNKITSLHNGYRFENVADETIKGTNIIMSHSIYIPHRIHIFVVFLRSMLENIK